MKYLMTCVAIAASLTVAAPTWAHTPGAGATTAADPAPMGQCHYRTVRHMSHHRWHRSGRPPASDAMAALLNREELARIQSGGVMFPARIPEPIPPPAVQGPRPSSTGGYTTR